MDRVLGEQITRREDVFRDVNEAIERGHWPGEDDPVAFRCECGRLGCSQMVELPSADYRRVRENSRRFIVAPGHEVPDLEDVVEATNRYVVVEKRGEAGQLAEKSASEG